MLIGTQHDGLLMFLNERDPGTQIPIENISGSSDYTVPAIEYDSKRNLSWIFVQNYGLFVYDHKRK